jgi:TetR/AcrR family transcriptional regulator
MARFNSEQKSKILEAAIGVFAKKGLKGSTTRLIGRAARVNSALIYYYFENKASLFAEAAQYVIRGFLAHLQASRHPFPTARDRLAYLVDGVFDYYSTHPDRMRLVVQMINMHPDLMARAMSAVLSEQKLVPLEILAEGVACGQLRPVQPLQAWLSIVSLSVFSVLIRDVLGHVAGGILPLTTADLEERRHRITDLLVHGLATQQQSTEGTPA